MASWLVHLSLDRVVWVQALARDIALCSWARHFTHVVPLSIQVYKRVPVNLMLGVTLRWPKKYVETYSSYNVAAQNPEERVFYFHKLIKSKHNLKN